MLPLPVCNYIILYLVNGEFLFLHSKFGEVCGLKSNLSNNIDSERFNNKVFYSQGHSQGRGAPESTTETVTMSGKERREYEAWKREREKIDQERIRRHKQATTGDQGMQWNPGKEKAVEEEWKENVTLPAKQ